MELEENRLIVCYRNSLSLIVALKEGKVKGVQADKAISKGHVYLQDMGLVINLQGFLVDIKALGSTASLGWPGDNLGQ